MQPNFSLFKVLQVEGIEYRLNKYLQVSCTKIKVAYIKALLKYLVGSINGKSKYYLLCIACQIV